MNIIDALINAIAVWFVLKAVEVIPFAIYDLYVWIQECFSPSDQDKHENRFDRRRGKLEFIFSGTGFFQFSLFRQSKAFFLVALLVPLVIFVLELLSIFLGNEKRVCETSRDPNVVRAPALRLFGEGEREVDVVDMNDEIVASGRLVRPCFQRESTHSGVEYVTTVCSDVLRASAPHFIKQTLFPDHERISVSVLKSFENETDLILNVLTRPLKNSFRDALIIGAFHISCDVFVNGRSSLASDAIKNFVINETITAQILDDVRILEKARNSTPSEFIENSGFFLFEWADLDDFFIGATNVIFALMSQSRRVGLQTATEMSAKNVQGVLPEVDILCKEDFFLPRTASIIIMVTAAALRLLLLGVPTSLSCPEYALLHSGKREEYERYSEFPLGLVPGATPSA